MCIISTAIVANFPQITKEGMHILRLRTSFREFCLLVFNYRGSLKSPVYDRLRCLICDINFSINAERATSSLEIDVDGLISRNADKRFDIIHHGSGDFRLFKGNLHCNSPSIKIST